MTGIGVPGLEILDWSLGGSALTADYLARSPRALRFYAGAPGDMNTIRAKVAAVDARFTPELRRRLGEAIRPTSALSATRLREVVNGRGLLVTTGQQAGLFSGPLYTIYKAIATAHAARTLERALERPVLPLFWVASEDHDWAEVNHAYVVDTKNSLRRIGLAEDAEGGDDPDPAPPMWRRPLGPGIETAIAGLEEALPPSEFTPGLLAMIRESHDPRRPVSEAFSDLLSRLLEPFDMLLVDAAHPTVKALSRPVLEAALRDGASTEEALARRAGDLHAAGYHAQVPILPDATNLFLDGPEGRERLLRQKGGLVLRRSRRRVEPDEVGAMIERDPRVLSPNVLLRPVVENAVFPTVAYIAGPSEIAYYAQLEPLFRAHDVMAPSVLPRAAFLLIEGKVRKVLRKFGLSPEALAEPLHEVASRVVRADLPEAVSGALAGLRDGIAAGYETLERAAQPIDSTLSGPISAARNGSLHELEGLEKKIVHHVKMARDVELAQLEKAAVNLFPGGHAQERVLNVFQFLARYGPGLLAEIAGALPDDATIPALPASRTRG